MARRRRSPDQAKKEILAAATRLLQREGPSALRIARVADEAGMSHPGLLHHFGTADALKQALHVELSRQVRDELLEVLSSDEERSTAIETAAARLADPSKGRLLAWLIATGAEPFPPSDERGLEAVTEAIVGDSREARYRVLLVVLAMYAESMLGSALRERIGLADEDPAEFRSWLLSRL